MGLNHHAQAVVDEQIKTLFAAFWMGYSMGAKVRSLGAVKEYAIVGFATWLAEEMPNLYDYLDKEKLL